MVADVGAATQRIFAVDRFRELARYALIPPDLSSSALRAPDEVIVPRLGVSIDCILRIIRGRVVAVVNDSLSHATEDQLDQVEGLRTSA